MKITGNRMADLLHWYVAVVLKKPTPPAPQPAWGALTRLYVQEGGAEDVRGDVAFFQAAKETAWFQFTGRVPASAFNYAGIGAVNSTTGYNIFPDAKTGVRAHIQHLCAYMGRPLSNLANPCVDPRYTTVLNLGYKTDEWTGLNGHWAVPGTTYGQDIEAMHRAFCTAMGVPVG